MTQCSFYKKMLTPLRDRVISLKGEVSDHKTNANHPYFIEVIVPS
jgi:hypothetical protein